MKTIGYIKRFRCFSSIDDDLCISTSLEIKSYNIIFLELQVGEYEKKQIVSSCIDSKESN